MQISFEEIKGLLKYISTPTGYTNSGDKTLTENDSKDIINYIENLQQRIDKAIKYINNTTIFCTNGEVKNLKDEIIGIKLLTILQDEEVKDNEL